MIYVYPIPQPITLLNLDGLEIKDEGGKPVVFPASRFVTMLLSDPQWGASMSTVLMQSNIKRVVDDAKKSNTPYWEFEQDDFKMLLHVLEEPTKRTNPLIADIRNQTPTAYDPSISHNFSEFMRAIKYATDKRPEIIQSL